MIAAAMSNSSPSFVDKQLHNRKLGSLFNESKSVEKYVVTTLDDNGSTHEVNSAVKEGNDDHSGNKRQRYDGLIMQKKRPKTFDMRKKSVHFSLEPPLEFPQPMIDYDIKKNDLWYSGQDIHSFLSERVTTINKLRDLNQQKQKHQQQSWQQRATQQHKQQPVAVEMEANCIHKATGNPTTNDVLCLRGHEPLYYRSATVIREIQLERKLFPSIILLEQERQRQLGFNDPFQIQCLAWYCSKNAKLRARHLALLDAKEILLDKILY